MSSNSNLHKENKRLTHQLEIKQAELRAIKGSKGYGALRLIGYAKNEIKRSPTSFAKKAAKKIFNKGALNNSIGFIDKNLTSIEDLAEQYKTWITLNEPDEVDLENQIIEYQKFDKKPLISIVTPVFNPPKQVFIDLIESVIAQTYPNFELCLGNFGDDKEIEEIINAYSKQDPRIKNYLFSKNEGIAENSNKILAKTKGEFIALLDHDDTISPDALFENVKIINDKEVDFIFSDKDKINEAGDRFEPFFKPGWSPEIMLNANYLTHLNVMRKTIVNEAGGWSSSTDGAQDWDLFLKIMCITNKIEHIPKVLYHWRVIATSTALSIETKPYALLGQRNAIDKYLTKNKIPAESYHAGAELLLKWKHIKEKINIIVFSSSQTQTLKFVSLLQSDEQQNYKFTILSTSSFVVHDKQFEVITHSKDSRLSVLKNLISNKDSSYYCIVTDKVDLSSLTSEKLNNLLGWLSISGVGAVYPRITEYKTGLAIDCGAVVMGGKALPLFIGSPPYHQAPIGNIEWVKDFILGSSSFFVSTGASLKKAVDFIDNGIEFNDARLSSALQLAITHSGERIVFNPKEKYSLVKQANFNAQAYYDLVNDELASLIPDKDPYSNYNLSNTDPMRLKEIANEETMDVLDNGPTLYNIEALAHALSIRVGIEEINTNHKNIKSMGQKKIEAINPSFLFIIPGFTGIYAGLNNIFSYAEYILNSGNKVSFGLMVEEKNIATHKDLIAEKFPELASKCNFFSVSVAGANLIPEYDVAICTQWATAYVLVKYNKCRRKCYFIQDKEASFYSKGTISALVDNTYRFGFYAIANTPGLLKWYQEEYDGDGISIKSKVDSSVYAPPKSLNVSPSLPYRVFFYARPGEPRNAFELGAAALILLKEKYKDKVEIFAAGANWSPEDYELESVMTNLGKINFEKLPSFYRSMDAGLMFMFSGHPGVVASELMASGCPVVVNEYDDETWSNLYKDCVNSVVCLPTAKAVFEGIDNALTNIELRQKIIPNALDTIKDFYKDYDKACEQSIIKLRNKIS